MRPNPFSLALGLRRVVLQQLGHRLLKVLLLLLGFGFGVECLRGCAAPDQLLRLRGIHIETNLADMNGRRPAGRHSRSHAAAVPPTPPAGSVPPIAVERCVLLLLP